MIFVLFECNRLTLAYLAEAKNTGIVSIDVFELFNFRRDEGAQCFYCMDVLWRTLNILQVRIGMYTMQSEQPIGIKHTFSQTITKVMKPL